VLQGGRGAYGGPTLAGVPGERAFSVAGPERDWGIAVATPRPGDPARYQQCMTRHVSRQYALCAICSQGVSS
jgi:hypothetical protein